MNPKLESISYMDDRTKIICRSRDRLRARMLHSIVNPPPKRLIHRVKDMLELIWAYFWAITFGGVWIEMGENAGLWEYVGDEE